MVEALLIAIAVLLVAVVALQLLTLRRSSEKATSRRMEEQVLLLRAGDERMERALREELSRGRDEASQHAQRSRDEVGRGFRHFTESLGAQLQGQEGRLDRIRQALDEHLERMGAQSRDEAAHARAELGASLTRFEATLFGAMGQVGKQVEQLKGSNEQKLEGMRLGMETQIRSLQEDNHRQLEQMRATVDEKLHATLEARLGESFRLVSDRLEQVHRGLGEMQTLASGVGDLKKVLTNVKTRGIWGELQLESLLEQMLAPDQYAKNVKTKVGSNDHVEFAVRFPGKDNSNGIWLPIDAKFPQEDYHRLLEAQEQANGPAAEDAARKLEERIKSEAKAIREKYIDPPHTTDFGIMFLPVEGLFAEVLRRPGLTEVLHREYRVMLTGPTTLAALLQSLRMGFNTLAIEKRSSEVWELLRGVKAEFGRFGDILEKTRRKLEQASADITEATTRTRRIEQRLKDVHDTTRLSKKDAPVLPLLARMEQRESDVET